MEFTLKDIKNKIVYNNYAPNNISLQENGIEFCSDFESGNIDLVARTKLNEYSLYIRPDTNTERHFQWFYFRIKIKNPNKSLSLTIKNFVKPNMLYNSVWFYFILGIKTILPE